MPKHTVSLGSQKRRISESQLDALTILPLEVSPSSWRDVPSMLAPRNELRHALETDCLQCMTELVCCPHPPCLLWLRSSAAWRSPSSDRALQLEHRPIIPQGGLSGRGGRARSKRDARTARFDLASTLSNRTLLPVCSVAYETLCITLSCWRARARSNGQISSFVS